MECGRDWLVVVCDGVEWISDLPRTAEVWQVKGSRSSRGCLRPAQSYVIRFANPVSLRRVVKLPVVSVHIWSQDGHILKDRTMFTKMKDQPANYINFYKQFKKSE